MKCVLCNESIFFARFGENWLLLNEQQIDQSSLPGFRIVDEEAHYARSGARHMMHRTTCVVAMTKWLLSAYACHANADPIAMLDALVDRR